MSHCREDAFTCDRCLRCDRLTAGKQPDGWLRITLTSPPLASPADGDPPRSRLNKLQHLCNQCVYSLDEWANPRTGVAS